MDKRTNLPTANNQLRPLEVVIESKVVDTKRMEELVKFARKIEKEYSCNCTLTFKV